AELKLERLLEFPLRPRKFQPVSKFPAVDRDLSLVVPDEIPYARLASAVRALGIDELREFYPVDCFRGGAIPPRCYSLLLRLILQSHTRTLTSDEVAELTGRMLAALEALGAHLRS